MFKVILLAGGEGKRLRPLTQSKAPKPFLPLFSGKSLFQITIERFIRFGFGKNIVCTTPNTQGVFLKKQLAAYPVPQKILLEPSLRDTGPATLWATKMLLEMGEISENDRCILVPSDQILEDEASFFMQLQRALKKKPRLTVFGAAFEEFDPSFGYFSVDGDRVKEFVEKPQNNINGGCYFRNSGHFLFTPKLLMNEGEQAENFIRGKSGYADLPKLSIDKMLLEKSKNLYHQPLGTCFTDLGTWKRLNLELERNLANQSLK